MILNLDSLPKSVLVDNEQERALAVSRLLRVDDVSSHLKQRKDCHCQIQVMSHFTRSLFSFTKVESFGHVDVVHRAVEGAGVEDLPLDQGGGLHDQDQAGDDEKRR